MVVKQVSTALLNMIKISKDFMKIKFSSDDSLPLNKTLNLHNMKIVIRSVFEEDGKFYLQAYVDECMYEL